MTTNEPIERFREAAITMDEGSVKQANRACDEAVAALRELRKEPDRGEAKLVGLLTDEKPSVVYRAAVSLLIFPNRVEEALATLRCISDQQQNFIGFNARQALELWAAGELKLE